jgi:hypothetical protein
MYQVFQYLRAFKYQFLIVLVLSLSGQTYAGKGLEESFFLWLPPFESTLAELPPPYKISKQQLQEINHAIELDDPAQLERIIPAENLLKVRWGRELYVSRKDPTHEFGRCQPSLFGGVVLKGKVNIVRYIFGLPSERTAEAFSEIPGSNEKLLHLAILSKNLEMVRLIAYQFPYFLNRNDYFSGSPLELASGGQSTFEIFQFIWQLSPTQVYSLNKSRRTLLHSALESKKIELVRFISQNAPALWEKKRLLREHEVKAKLQQDQGAKERKFLKRVEKAFARQGLIRLFSEVQSEFLEEIAQGSGGTPLEEVMGSPEKYGDIIIYLSTEFAAIQFQTRYEQEIQKRIVSRLRAKLASKFTNPLPSMPSNQTRKRNHPDTQAEQNECANSEAKCARIQSQGKEKKELLGEGEWVQVLPVTFPEGQKGLFARRDIPKGTILGIYEGKIYTQSALKKKVPRNEDYINMPENGYFFDARTRRGTFCFAINGQEPETNKSICLAARANHSDVPNAEFKEVSSKELDFGERPKGYTLKDEWGVVLVAREDIPVGKEILVHYGDDYADLMKDRYTKSFGPLAAQNVANIQQRTRNLRLDPAHAVRLWEDAQFHLENAQQILDGIEELTMSNQLKLKIADLKTAVLLLLKNADQSLGKSIELAEDANRILGDSKINQTIKKMYDLLSSNREKQIQYTRMN